MIPLETLQRIADSGARLRAAVAHDYKGDPRFTSYVSLEFESSRLILSTAEEDDSIALSTDLPAMIDCVARDEKAWIPALGRALLWGWTLTNHQGCVDGVRFDFRNTVSDSPVIIEVLVAASRLHTIVVPGAV
ncbi:MAG TPA: DUF6334 family protein [Polyangia bacterium]|jgi:hypothetical protein|nr:DUF6334 family protein [Polyangia bacterium]